jgi:hypothetical protein
VKTPFFAIATLCSALTAVAPALAVNSGPKFAEIERFEIAARATSSSIPWWQTAAERRPNVTRSDNFKPTVLGEIHAAGDRRSYLHFPIHRSGSAIEWRTRTGARSAPGVRREKAARFQWVQMHPATAPAGSNRSCHGGDELAEAFG